MSWIDQNRRPQLRAMSSEYSRQFRNFQSRLMHSGRQGTCKFIGGSDADLERSHRAFLYRRKHMIKMRRERSQELYDSICRERSAQRHVAFSVAANTIDALSCTARPIDLRQEVDNARQVLSSVGSAAPQMQQLDKIADSCSQTTCINCYIRALQELLKISVDAAELTGDSFCPFRWLHKMHRAEINRNAEDFAAKFRGVHDSMIYQVNHWRCEALLRADSLLESALQELESQNLSGFSEFAPCSECR